MSDTPIGGKYTWYDEINRRLYPGSKTTTSSTDGVVSSFSTSSTSSGGGTGGTGSGVPGPPGPQGIPGNIGPQGIQGIQGEPGIQGDPGTTIHSALSELAYAESGHTGFEPAKGDDDNYVTDAQVVVISNTSGINTGDETQATIKTKLGAATYGVDGYLKATDWDIFNNKLNNLNGAVLTNQTDPQTIGSNTLRLTKLWATDLNVTNPIAGSVSGTSTGIAGTTLLIDTINEKTIATGVTIDGVLIKDGGVTASELWVPIVDQDLTTKTYVDSLAATVIYIPTSLNVITSDGFTGDVDSLAVYNDADILHVDEAPGVPGFDVNVTFTDVVSFNNILVYQEYHGGSNHTIHLELYDPNTTTWDVVHVFTDEDRFVLLNIPIVNGSSYIDAGTVISKLHHEDGGNASHSLEIDYFVLRDTPTLGGGGGETHHANMTGLIEDDHHQYALLDGRNGDILSIDNIVEYTPAHGVEVETILIKDNTIDAQDGIAKHLIINAGDAAGAAGTDAGDLTLKAGSALNADSGSTGGYLFLVPGNQYSASSNALVYLGDSTTISNTVSLGVQGSQDHVNLTINAKGSGNINIGSGSTSILANGPLVVNGQASVGGDLIFVNEINSLIRGSSGGPGDIDGHSLTVRGGTAYPLGDGDGGNLLLYGGAKNGAGIVGDIYFGDTANGFLKAKSSETNVVYYETTTGRLSYGTVDAAESYTNETPTPTTIGGIAAGSTFSLASMTEMWDALLYPYQVPTFTAFAVTGYNAILECGVNFTGGAQTFTWTTSNPSNVQTNSIALRDVTNAVDLNTGLANDGTESETLTAGTQTTNGATRQWGIRGTDTNANQIGYRYITTTFYMPIYHGVGAAGLSVAQLQALTKRVTGEVSFSALFTTSGNKIYIAYPSAWGNLTSIKDVNLFDITSDFTQSTLSFTNNPTNYNGVTTNYYVYEYNNNTTLTNFLVYFNF